MARYKRQPASRAASDPRKKPRDHAFLMERQKDAAAARRPWDRDWWVNLAYVNNEQYVEFVDATGRLVPKEFVDGVPTPINNQSLKITRKERAKLLKVPPRPQALPATEDDDSLQMARVLNAYFDWLMWQWRFPRLTRQIAFWMVVTGNSFQKWGWLPGEDGAAESGMPFMRVVSPFEIYLDPHAKTFEECRWLIHSQFLDEESAWDMYGDLKGSSPEHLTMAKASPMSDLEYRMYSDLGTTGNGKSLEGVSVYEYWEPPTTKSDGYFMVFTQSGIVYEAEEYPLEHGRMPFTQSIHIERSSSKYGAAILDYTRPFQDEINRAESEIIMNRANSGGKWFVHESTELSEPLAAVPNQVIKWAGRERPELTQADALPAWVLNEPARLSMAMSDLADQHEISNGDVPGRLDSGQAVQLVMEAEDLTIKDSIHSLNEALADGFWQIAALTKQYGPTELVVNTYNPDGFVEVHKLMTDKIDLKFRIITQTTSALPTSISGKWDRVLNLVQYQVITPQQAARLLELTVADPSLDMDKLDRTLAYRENKIMEAFSDKDTDIIPQVMWYHNNPIHIEVHTAFMKSKEYEGLAEDTKMLYQKHVEDHQKMQDQLNAQAAQAQAAAEAPQGTPAPQAPAPPSPEAAGPAEVVNG